MESPAIINQRLKDTYGCGVTIYNRPFELSNNSSIGTDSGIDKPKFRLIWSTNQTEVRYGEYEIYSESGDIFLRKESKVEEVEKYPLWPDKWILEQLMSTEGNPYLEKAGHKYSYEPRWVFGNANSDPIPVWKYVKLLCDQCLLMNRVVKSPSDIEEEELQAKAKEKELFKEMLQDESPYLAGMLHNADGIKSSGVVVDGFRDNKLRKK